MTQFSKLNFCCAPGVYKGLAGETTNPADAAPKKTMGNSGTLGITIPTTSPGFKPRTFSRDTLRLKVAPRASLYLYERPVRPHV